MHSSLTRPFGFWLLEKLDDRPTPPLSEWKWKPKSNLDILAAEASLPGTTGTGPDARTDERQDEM